MIVGNSVVGSILTGTAGVVGGFVAFLIRRVMNRDPRRAITIRSPSGESIDVKVSAKMPAQEVQAILERVSELGARSSKPTA